MPAGAMCSIYIKNTFINGFEAENLGVAKGHHSYPPSPRDRGAFVLQLAQLDLAENLSSHHSHDSALVDVSDVQSSCDEIQASFETHASLKKKRSKTNRACKGKRLRYRKFVERVLHQIDEDPFSFHLGNVVLPPSLAANPKKLFFFRDGVQSYQQQLLAGEKPIGLRKLHQDKLVSQVVHDLQESC